MNKPQIKVKELPKDWLVLDHHVESGTVEFISINETIDDSLHISYPKEIFGTKHIQLIAVNVTPLSSDSITKTAYFGYGVALSWEQAEPIKYMYASGKDFFIYKVTENK